MPMTRITSEHVAEPQPETWSNCKVVGDQIFVSGMYMIWDRWRPDLREAPAHLVGHFMRRFCGIASAGFVASFV